MSVAGRGAGSGLGGLDRERWRRIERVLDGALDLPPEERPDWLRRQCGVDEGLRAEVERLLAADATGEHALDRPAQLAAADLLADDGEPASSAESAGTRVGPWRLVREIGRGGMGTVHLAERADGHFEQRAAVKLVRRGLDTEEILERFRRERQILARLEHPHIARLLDGGAAADGRPYLALEYVEGQTITAWCDARQATVEERLRLFEKACRAVQHAHRSLVVHRDLKPSNILVDAAGAVKLLDFGIARLLAGEGEGTATRTAAGPQVLTPQYAAPEQMRGEATTTATDVYGLGMVLYELLAGGPPYRVDTSSFERAREIVASSPVAPPSRAVVAGDDSGAAVAGARGTGAHRLAEALRGDLDTIVLTALEKDPARRYPSVEALLEDLERRRARLPLRARPSGRLDRLRRSIARHRLGYGLAAAAFVVLAGYAVTTGLMLRAQQQERERAEAAAREARAIQDFLTGLIGAAGPTRLTTGFAQAGSANPEARVRDVLDQAAAEVDGRFGNDPPVRAALHQVIADAYVSLGRYDAAVRHARDAVALREGTGDAVGLAQALSILSLALDRADRDAEAVEVGWRAVAVEARVHGLESAEAAVALQNLTGSLRDLGRFAEAESLDVEALRVLRGTVGPDDPRLLTALNAVGAMRLAGGDYAAAESLHREAWALLDRRYGPDHTFTLVALTSIATALYQQGRHAEAESLQRIVLARRREVLGPVHPQVATTLNALGMSVRNQGRLEEAEPLLREAWAMRDSLLGAEHRETLVSASALANLLRQRGRLVEAEALHREALAARRRTIGPEHVLIASSLQGLGETLAAAGRTREAEAALREAWEMRGRVQGAGHPDRAKAGEALARLLEREGRAGEAAAVRADTAR